jgi:hypothetical protein
VTVIVIGLAFVLAELGAVFRMRIDLSADSVATLQPETIATLEAVTQQEVVIEIIAFSAQQKGAEAWMRDRMIRDVLVEFRLRCPSLKTRFVNFDADRLTAEALGVSRYGTVVVRSETDRVDLIDRELFRRKRGAKKDVAFYGESAIARAIAQILSEDEKTLYVLAGHGEHRISEHSSRLQGSQSLKVLPKLFETQGWKAKELNLLGDSESETSLVIPSNASAVLLLGPSAALHPDEEMALVNYVAEGGRVGLFVDPLRQADKAFGRASLPLQDTLGISREPGVVLDKVALFPFEDRPVLRLGRHTITEALIEERLTTIVAHAAPIVLPKAEGLKSSVLMQTSRSGWVERGTERPATFNPEVDGPGPVIVAAALEIRPQHPAVQRNIARVVVVGDSDLLSDEFLEEGPGNSTFVVNTVRWLLGEEQRSSRVGRPGQVRHLALTREQLTRIRWVVLLFLPLCVVLAGGVIWWSRRNR